ncbi:hypothetical protein [Mesorhizobium sp.]|nr:hypothetical protein [Mesorhizobium sp.]
MKAVRTDRELECPEIDAGLRARGGVDLVVTVRSSDPRLRAQTTGVSFG